MKKNLFLPILLFISLNASAAKFMIMNGTKEAHIHITFKICTVEGCTSKSAEGTPGKIFEQQIKIPPGQVVEVIGLTGRLNRGTPVTFGEPHCRKKFTNDSAQGLFALVASRDGGLYCFGI